MKLFKAANCKNSKNLSQHIQFNFLFHLDTKLMLLSTRNRKNSFLSNSDGKSNILMNFKKYIFIYN